MVHVSGMPTPFWKKGLIPGGLVFNRTYNHFTLIPPNGGRITGLATHAEILIHLAVDKYIAMFPLIPPAELHGSSIEHPRGAPMRWLLHTRRVATRNGDAKRAAPSTAASSGAPQPVGPLPKCVGVGDPDMCSWMCSTCVGHLCNCRRASMPLLARANANGLGREQTL